MNNLKFSERFEQAHGIRIEKLFWIAGSLENDDLKDFISDIRAKYLKELFPEIEEQEILDYVESEEIGQMLCDYTKFGFIAELHYPVHKNFSFNMGKFLGCTVSTSRSRVCYAYAETPAQLMDEIERIAKREFEYDLSKEKTNNPTT